MRYIRAELRWNERRDVGGSGREHRHVTEERRDSLTLAALVMGHSCGHCTRPCNKGSHACCWLFLPSFKCWMFVVVTTWPPSTRLQMVGPIVASQIDLDMLNESQVRLMPVMAHKADMKAVQFHFCMEYQLEFEIKFWRDKVGFWNKDGYLPRSKNSHHAGHIV